MRDKLWMLFLVVTLPVIVVAVSLVGKEVFGKDEELMEQKLNEIDELLKQLNERDARKDQENGSGLEFKIADVEHSTKSGHLVVRGTSPIKKGVVFVRWVMYGYKLDEGEGVNEDVDKIVLVKPQLLAIPVENDGGFVVRIELPGMRGEVDLLFEQDNYRKQIMLDLGQADS